MFGKSFMKVFGDFFKNGIEYLEICTLAVGKFLIDLSTAKYITYFISMISRSKSAIL